MGVFTVATGVLGGLAAALALWAPVRLIWRRTVGQRRLAARQLKPLAPNYRLERFISLLGEPALEARLPTDNGPSAFREWIWVDPLYFVQAITEGDSQTVERFSVASRSPRFHPQFTIRGIGDGKPFKVKLQRTTFAEMPRRFRQENHGTLGAHHWHYRETYYFGNPGGYQYYEVGMSNAVLGRRLGDVTALRAFGRRPDDPAVPPLEDFQRGTTITIYGESRPLGDRPNDPFLLGPDYTQVRVLGER